MASNTYNITPKRLNSDGDYDTINFNTIADDVYFNNTNSATSYATYGLPCLTSTQNQGTTAELAYYTRTGWFPMPSGVGLTVDAWNSTTRILSAYNTTTVLTAVDGNYYMSVGDKIKFTGTTDNSTYYGIITGVSINGTSLYYSIFFGQNVSSYAGGAPKNIYYSKQKSPTGFPTFPVIYDQLLAARIPFESTGTFYSGSFSFPSGLSISDYEFLIATIGNDNRVFGDKGESQSFIIVPTLITSGTWNVYISDNFKAGGHWTINDTAISANYIGLAGWQPSMLAITSVLGKRRTSLYSNI